MNSSTKISVTVACLLFTAVAAEAMTKADIIEEIANETGLSKEDSESALDAVLDDGGGTRRG